MSIIIEDYRTLIGINNNLALQLAEERQLSKNLKAKSEVLQYQLNLHETNRQYLLFSVEESRKANAQAKKNNRVIIGVLVVGVIVQALATATIVARMEYWHEAQ